MFIICANMPVCANMVKEEGGGGFGDNGQGRINTMHLTMYLICFWLIGGGINRPPVSISPYGYH